MFTLSPCDDSQQKIVSSSIRHIPVDDARQLRRRGCLFACSRSKYLKGRFEPTSTFPQCSSSSIILLDQTNISESRISPRLDFSQPSTKIPTPINHATPNPPPRHHARRRRPRSRPPRSHRGAVNLTSKAYASSAAGVGLVPV